MDEIQERSRAVSERDGFAWASLITGSISLFYADRLIYPGPQDYFLLVLFVPAAGLLTAVVAHQRMRRGSTSGGRELAVAGVVLSGISAASMLLTKIFVN